MIRAGITGGIGSGKTTVCKLWESLGARVVYADEIAKQLMTEDDHLKKGIIAAFGAEAYHANGLLNREYLSEQAFRKGRVEELNALVHPAVYKKTDELIKEAEKDGVSLFVKEAALLLKNGRPPGLDVIILVVADEGDRIGWVSERDKTDRNSVTDRIKNQQDFDKLRPLADIILENYGSKKELLEKGEKLFNQLVETGKNRAG
jgi:dephospho-CoA kinase